MYSVTVAFNDCCLPDYFRGHPLPVLQIPVHGNTTRNGLCNALISELNSGAIDWQIDNDCPGLEYEQIREAIIECLYFHGNCKESDKVFPDLAVWADDDIDGQDSVYAFFVLCVERVEND